MCNCIACKCIYVYYFEKCCKQYYLEKDKHADVVKWHRRIDASTFYALLNDDF